MVQRGGVTIVYDGDGNRVMETVAGVTTKYLVGEINPTGYTQVFAELNGTNGLLRGYEWGLELEAVRDFTVNSFGIFHYYGHDGHGSVRWLTNSSGVISDTYDYDAFGNLIGSTGTTINNYLFAGEQFDPALGIYYNRARYYDQRQGRFWTMDTFEGDSQSPASLHKYLYAGANPTDRIDPSGHDDLVEINLTVALYSALGSMAVTTAFGAFAATTTLINLPKDFKTQILKPPSAAVVGISATVNVGRFLSKIGVEDTSVGAGAVVGLQFLSLGGGFEAVMPTTLDRIWFYGYLGAFYSLPFGHYNANGLSSDFTGVAVWPGVNPGFIDDSLYVGAIWNLKNKDDYKGPFSCVSGSLLLGMMGIHLTPNATLCSAANGVFSVTTDLTGMGGGPKGSLGSSMTEYDYLDEFPRGKD